MDLFMLALVVGAVFAIRAAWRHATEARSESRATALKAAAKKSPAPLSNARKQMVARQHDTGWWLSEAAHGFPVLRTGLHAGWLAHKAATLQGRHKVEEARTTHAELSADFATAMAEHKARQDEALAQIRKQIEGDPAAGKEAVQKAAENVLPFVRPSASEPKPAEATSSPAAPPAGPYAPKADPPKEPACSACGHPARPGDDLVPTPEGWQVHQSHISDPQSGFYKPPPAAEPVTDRKATIPPTTPARGVPAMPTGTSAASEMTYDQTITKADQVKAAAEAHQADLAKLGIPALLDSLSSSGLDRGTLGRAADVNDAYERATKAAQDMLDRAAAFQAGLRRDHGHVNEAHQAAPEGGAERPFYLPG